MILKSFLNLVGNDLLNHLRVRRKPNILQMPITSRCNSRCVTCNIWKEHTKVDINPEKLREILSDPFFSEVKSVGLNGGELTLVPNFFDILDAVLSLPKIESVHLISNGLLPDKLLSLLEKTKQICDKRNVRLGFTLSVDGVGQIHEQVRGIPKSFERTKYILDAFKLDPERYFYYGVIGCTLSTHNIYYVREMEVFFENYPLTVEWHIAVPNKRIHTFYDSERYYLLNDDEARLLAVEFFYGKMCESKAFRKFRWFAQYYFLLNKGQGRIAQCSYRYKDVTIDENLFLYLCATASDEIGDLNVDSIRKIKKEKAFSKEACNIGKYCDQCIHYVYDNPTIKGGIIFLWFIMQNKFKQNRIFKFLAKW